MVNHILQYDTAIKKDKLGFCKEIRKFQNVLYIKNSVQKIILDNGVIFCVRKVKKKITHADILI